MDDWEVEEILRKLELIERRVEEYKNFVAAEDEPPLLWQMAMLAQAGWTILPRVDDPNPQKQFSEIKVEMRELEWGPDYAVLIGGHKFQVMRVSLFHQFLMIPIVQEFRYYDVSEGPSPSDLLMDQEVYRQDRWVVAVPPSGVLDDGIRIMLRLWICEGSRADELMKQRKEQGLHRL